MMNVQYSYTHNDYSTNLLTRNRLTHYGKESVQYAYTQNDYSTNLLTHNLLTHYCKESVHYAYTHYEDFNDHMGLAICTNQPVAIFDKGSQCILTTWNGSVLVID